MYPGLGVVLVGVAQASAVKKVLVPEDDAAVAVRSGVYQHTDLAPSAPSARSAHPRYGVALYSCRRVTLLVPHRSCHSRAKQARPSRFHSATPPEEGGALPGIGWKGRCRALACDREDRKQTVWVDYPASALPRIRLSMQRCLLRQLTMTPGPAPRQSPTDSGLS